MQNKNISYLSDEVSRFVRQGFKPRPARDETLLPSNPAWRRLRQLGTRLWLDTGSLSEAGELWTREFDALTTNNTLLNKEVQTGAYDHLIAEAAEMLSQYNLSPRQKILELTFILNARHGLRLVSEFDGTVSVEEHTDLAHDVGAAVEYGRRYHAICPERFVVKIPFTPAGLLATRKLSQMGISVNHTLGFSARQNYVIARLARPAYVNVFLGRLNAFVADNGLGDGKWVGEKAMLASQAAIRDLRETHGLPTLQIGASFRAGPQVRDLAGIDVMTLPPKVAKEFLDLVLPVDQLQDRTTQEYRPVFKEGIDPASVGLATLWDIDAKLVACVEELAGMELDDFTPDELTRFFAARGCGDFLVPWSGGQMAASRKEGKIPRLDNWRELLAAGAIGLDSLMNLAGLSSFSADQQAMDDRVATVLNKIPAGTAH
ncbi:MAG: transaldolase family protein [Phycisphaerae bacterium]|jgi:transaldolase